MNCLEQLIFHCHLTGFLKDTSLHLCRSASSFLLYWFFNYISEETVQVQSFLKLGSLQVLPWNLRPLISYFFCTYYLFNQFIKKNRKENFATGNAIYLLPRMIIQIANDNSIFRKEGISICNVFISGCIFWWKILSLMI
jgi:hypothetical protein